MKPTTFERQKHVYKNNDFVELVKDAVRFFNGTPVHALPPPETFTGTGVYAVYYIGKSGLYKQYGELNRLSYDSPIYVGKAVPKGWRQARTIDNPLKQGRELYGRLSEHARNIDLADGLLPKDFMCRFVIFEDAGSDMIGAIEAALIKLNQPLWNSIVDGFGNHDPGKGRYEQAKSEWDVLHPGRAWALKCKGVSKSRAQVAAKVRKHFELLERRK
jgi:Eco29kI restriction endonuclease